MRFAIGGFCVGSKRDLVMISKFLIVACFLRVSISTALTIISPSPLSIFLAMPGALSSAVDLKRDFPTCGLSWGLAAPCDFFSSAFLLVGAGLLLARSSQSLRGPSQVDLEVPICLHTYGSSLCREANSIRILFPGHILLCKECTVLVSSGTSHLSC